MQELVGETVYRMENVSNLVAKYRTMFRRHALDSSGPVEGSLTQEADRDQTAQVYGKVAIFDGFSG